MDWKKYKLGVGPMSPQVLNACLKYSKKLNFPLMIVASRNQVDYKNGYAFSTSELVNFIRSNEFYDPDRIKICRDHCGPNFSDSDKTLLINEKIHECKQTIKNDIENEFDLIHVDVGRCVLQEQKRISTDLIEYALHLNSKIYLEFGSEDNTGLNLQDTCDILEQQISFCSNFKNNLAFLVSQTGSLTKHTQVGTFDFQLAKILADKIHKSDFLFKEHNGDYLYHEQVKQRKLAGIDSVNIAPQLGYIHSSILYKLGYNYKYELNKFIDFVIQQDAWKKWIVDGIDDDQIKFLCSAHYFYKNEYYQIIEDIIKKKSIMFDDVLFNEISLVLDQYRIGFGE